MNPFASIRAWRDKGGLRTWLYIFFVFLAYAVLDLSLRYAYQELGLLGFEHRAAHMLSLGWCLALTGVAIALPGIVRKIYMTLSVLVFVALTAAHTVLYGLFHRFFMFSTLAYAGDGMAFADSQYIKPNALVVWAIVLSVLFLLLALFLAPSKGQQWFLIPLVVGLVLAGSGVSLALWSAQHWFFPKTQLVWDNYSDPSAVYESFTDSTSNLLMLGLYHYTFRDLCMTLDVGRDVSDEDMAVLEDYAAKRQALNQDNEYTGIFQGKNVILVQLEAIDQWMLCDEYMPNLWALKQDSMTFENHYSPAYITAGTLNTEFIANTGLLPARGNVSTVVYERNHYPFSLANQFKAAGYSTESFHGSEGNVYNRGTFHPAVGYSTYHSGEDMAMEDYTMDRYLMNGYPDIVREEPFLSFIITYSGHGPYHMANGAYVANAEAAHAMVPEYEGKYIYAVTGAMETDIFIGELIAAMEADGSLEDTVLVFYADHYNYYLMDDDLNMELKGVSWMDLLQKTDFFIYSKDRQPEKIEKFTSSLDIVPTLTNLFGLKDDGAVYLGNDAFSPYGNYVFFSSGSWYDGNRYWRSGWEITEEIAQRNQEIDEMFRMGNLILQADYFSLHKDEI